MNDCLHETKYGTLPDSFCKHKKGRLWGYFWPMRSYRCNRWGDSVHVVCWVWEPHQFCITECLNATRDTRDKMRRLTKDSGEGLRKTQACGSYWKTGRDVFSADQHTLLRPVLGLIWDLTSSLIFRRERSSLSDLMAMFRFMSANNKADAKPGKLS